MEFRQVIIIFSLNNFACSKKSVAPLINDAIGELDKEYVGVLTDAGWGYNTNCHQGERVESHAHIS